jgi:hypothetical protein
VVESELRKDGISGKLREFEGRLNQESEKKYFITIA